MQQPIWLSNCLSTILKKLAIEDRDISVVKDLQRPFKEFALEGRYNSSSSKK